MSALLDGYGVGGTIDTGAERLWDGPFFAPAEGTLDGWLLDAWARGTARYDALFIQNVTSADTVRACFGSHLGHGHLEPMVSLSSCIDTCLTLVKADACTL